MFAGKACRLRSRQNSLLSSGFFPFVIFMTLISSNRLPHILSRLKLFLALSRTPHGMIDMATPAFAALVWLGHPPSVSVTLLGILVTFAGYTAVYALNDVVDFRHDREKLEKEGVCVTAGDLDAVLVRHPMACGFLTFRQGLIWTAAWATVAVICAYLLNPVCLWIFAAGCLLETAYCLLWRVSHYRVLVSGAVKTLGAVAAVFAVDRSPSLAFVTVLFLCLFFWEIGGQNIPNDWTDIGPDARFGAKTIPVLLGPQRSALLIIGSILMALLLIVAVFRCSSAPYAAAYPFAAVSAGIFLLLMPALRLWNFQSCQDAMSLFNKASYYPLMLMIIALVRALA